MTTTYALLKGINPYALSSQPAYTNDYGIGFSAATLPFANIFGPTLFIHRMVSAFFILTCCAILFAVMRAMAIPFFLSTFAVIFFYGCQLYPGTTTACANPAPLGTMLFLLAIFFPWKQGYSYGGLLGSALLVIAAYYTKPYFLLAAPIMGSYLFFFISKKKGLAFAAAFFALFTISIFIMIHFFPCYFIDCFIILDNIRCLSWEHAFQEFSQLILLHSWLLILLEAMAVISLARYLLKKSTISMDYKKALKKFNLTAFDEPLWDIPFPIALYSGIFCFIVYALLLSRHEAASLWYFFHLVSPFLVIGISWAVAQFNFWPFLFTPFLIFNLFVLTKGNTIEKFDRNNTDWKAALELIRNHHNILAPPLICPLLVEANEPFYDNGITEYFLYGSYCDNNLTKKFFKSFPEIIKRDVAFNRKILAMVKNQEFDLIFLQYGYAPLMPDQIPEYYRPVGPLNLPGPQAGGSLVSVWVPRNTN